MSQGSSDLLGGLLKDVSRSFYLTLRVLPAAIRRPIGLAYLLARSSDTIADTEAITKDQRLEVLAALDKRIQGTTSDPLRLESLAGKGTSLAEGLLLQRFEQALAILRQLEPADQDRIREVLAIIISGQALDVSRFGEADVDHIAALENQQQLDEYTYRVAGCVGEFWTKMCRAHVFPRAPLDDAFLLRNGVRFGKGLQLVNILRDLPVDLRLGRCYLPKDGLKNAGLQPADLLDPANEPRLRETYARYLAQAEDHLGAGWDYTNRLPRGSVRVRLACAWPVLIGLQTLGKLRTGNVLDVQQRIKISRKEVRQILLRSVFWYPWPQRWARLGGAR